MMTSLLSTGCDRWSCNDCCIREICSFQKPPLQRLLFSQVCLMPILLAARACGTRLIYFVLWEMRFAHFPQNKVNCVRGAAAQNIYFVCGTCAKRRFHTQKNQALAAGEHLRS